VILLLDEQLDSPDMIVARSLEILGKPHNLGFRSLRTESPGLEDDAIPPYCKREGIDALVTANFRDFGAKPALYEALLAAGASVVVLRPHTKRSLSVDQQVSVLSKHMRTIGKQLHDAAPSRILLRVNESSCVRRTLEELREEITGQGLP
jgi:hypothetical protein